MPVVLDASIVAAWMFPDENPPIARSVRQRLHDDAGRAPALWWFEIRNVILIAERRGRITPADTADALRYLGTLNIGIDRGSVESEIVRLARQHRLTAYDAAYLELALRERIPLATLDQDLVRAAQTENVVLIGGA